MKNFFLLLLKGFLVGIGKIIPGVSGAVLAISLGIYEKCLKIISNLFTDFKNNIKFLLPIGIGFIFSVIVFSKVIVNLLEVYYLPTMLLFIGLIFGSLTRFQQEVDFQYKTNIFLFFMALAFTFSLTLVDFSNNFEYNFFILIIMGVVEAISMIVPGLSGTALLMLFGYYNLIIESFGTINLSILFPFFIGIMIGIFIFSKVISYFYDNHRMKTNVVIYGLSISSILILFLDTLKNNYSLFEIVISLCLLIVGYKIAKIMEK